MHNCLVSKQWDVKYLQYHNIKPLGQNVSIRCLLELASNPPVAIIQCSNVFLMYYNIYTPSVVDVPHK